MKIRESIRVLRSAGRSPSLRRVLAGYLLFATSEFGVWVAILVYGYRVGGSLGSAIAALVQLVPSTLLAPVVAVIGDRMSREKALAFGYGAQALTMGLAATAMTASAPVWAVYLCAAAAGVSVTMTRPVYGALLPALSRTPEELTGANAVSSWAEGLGIFAGPMTAGALLAASGPGLVFAVMAFIQILAAALALGVSPDEDAVRPSEPREKRRFLLQGVAEGYREARQEPGALLLVLLVAGQFAVVGMLDVLCVTLAFDVLHLDPSGPGVLTAGLGVGGLAGAAVAVILMGRRQLASPFVFGALASSGPLLLLCLPSGLTLSLALLAVAGAGKSFADVAARSLLQRTVRDDVLARVFGLQEGMSMAGLAFGSVLAPVLVAWFGGRGAFVAAGLFLPLAAVASWRALRTLDARATVPGRELERLRRIPVFGPLTPLIVERLCSRIVPMAFPGGHVVIRQGDSGDFFYVLDEGLCVVTVDDRFVATLKAGGYFGEIALLRRVPRTATVTATGPVKLLALGREDFLAAVTGSRRSTAIVDAETDRRLQAEADSAFEVQASPDSSQSQS